MFLTAAGEIVVSLAPVNIFAAQKFVYIGRVAICFELRRFSCVLPLPLKKNPVNIRWILEADNPPFFATVVAFVGQYVLCAQNIFLQHVLNSKMGDAEGIKIGTSKFGVTKLIKDALPQALFAVVQHKIIVR